MRRNAKWIGFDRRIEQGWVDFAANQVAGGASDVEVREALLGFLQSLAHDPEEQGSARPKTVRVILRMWGGVDDDLAELSRSAARLYASAGPADRIGLHWAMALAAYPYFYAHAAVIGRVLALQDSITADQIRRRITKHWGDRSTVYRTSRHVVRTMVAWGCLEETGMGRYGAVPRVRDLGSGTANALIHAILLNSESGSLGIGQLMDHPALFPFALTIDAQTVRADSQLTVFSDGAGGMMAGLERR